MENKRIAVYAIAKNEADHVYRWYRAIKEADGIFVLDTGSTDSTVQKLHNCDNVIVHKTFYDEHEPFRFDAARNHALSMVPNDFDYCMYLDLDEVMEDGWYARLQEALTTNPDCVDLRLVFSTLDNTETITYSRRAVHSIHDFKWLYPVHEVLDFRGLEPTVVATDIKVFHKPDLGKSRNYLDLLQLGVKEFNDGRANRYLGKEYVDREEYELAIPYLVKAIEVEQNNYHTSEAYKYLAECYEALNDPAQAHQAFIYSAWAAPDVRESWVGLATYCYRNQLYWECLSAVHQMMYINTPPTHSVIRLDYLYREWCHHMLATTFYALGQEQLAQQHINKAFELAPTSRAVLQDLITICKIPVTSI